MKEKPSIRDEATIEFVLDSEGRWQFDIYNEDGIVDGGCCTGSLIDAMGMASEQVKVLIDPEVVLHERIKELEEANAELVEANAELAAELDNAKEELDYLKDDIREE